MDELVLNRALFLAIEDVTYDLEVRGEQLPALVYEGRNTPDLAESEQTERERKIPDFYWAYYDQYADRGDFRKSFVVECKRLTQPPDVYAREYVKSGIARFINVEHSYGHGMASGAMVGYLQEIALDDALARINVIAAGDAIPPLILRGRDGEASAELESQPEQVIPKVAVPTDPHLGSHRDLAGWLAPSSARPGAGCLRQYCTDQFLVAWRDPRLAKRSQPLQQALVRHPQRHLDPGPLHLLARHTQEVGGRQFVVEHHEDGGPGAVVVGGALGGVVAQVRANPPIEA